MTFNRIGEDIFHIIRWIFDKNVIRWYNAMEPWKAMNWNDLYRKLFLQYSYNVDLPITVRDLTNQTRRKGRIL